MLFSLGRGAFDKLNWFIQTLQLSLSFLLINTESNFFKCYNIPITYNLKFKIVSRGFPWIVIALMGKCYKSIKSFKSFK